MILFAAIALVLFMVVSVVVGTRLLLLWRTTRRSPELLLGLALWCTGLLGFALGVAARTLIDFPMSRAILQALDLAGEYVGAAALALFAWRVYRPDVGWAKTLVIGWFVACLGGLTGEIVTGEYLRYTDDIPIHGIIVPVGLAIRGFAGLWVCAESVRYHGMLRRRLVLGLAEPLVVNRVGLWAIASGATAAGYMLSVVHRAVWGTGLVAHAWASGTTAAMALVAAVCLWLAFFPPKAYRRWIAGRAS